MVNARLRQFQRNGKTMRLSRDRAHKNAQMRKLSLSLNYKTLVFFFCRWQLQTKKYSQSSIFCWLIKRVWEEKKKSKWPWILFVYSDLWRYNTFYSAFCTMIFIVFLSLAMTMLTFQTDERFEPFFRKCLSILGNICRHSVRWFKWKHYFQRPNKKVNTLKKSEMNVKQLLFMNVCAQLPLSLIYLFWM